MHFTTGAITAILGSAILVHAVPAPEFASGEDEIAPFVVLNESGEVQSFQIAADLDVDIYGDIPDDFIQMDDHIEAEPGTKAWAWIRAQGDIDWDNVPDGVSITKRNSNLGVAIFTSTSCTGRIGYWDNVIYNNFNVPSLTTVMNWYSFQLSRRVLVPGEKLNLLRATGSNACGTVTSILADSSNYGCYFGGPWNCFMLTA